MTRTFLFAAGFAVAAIASSVAAHEYKAGDMVVDHLFTYATSKAAKAAGGYLTITNTGSTPDRLIAVEADFPRVMIHSTEEKDGVARMFHVEGVDIAPGETVALAPGGLHVMFMGLNGNPFETGEAVPATLVFEKAGRLEVVFNVEERKEGSHDHSSHSD